MAGKIKENPVSYFSHDIRHGKTLEIAEKRYGNDAYVLWFKMLEMLGRETGHFYDCRGDFEWEYFLAHTGGFEGEFVENLLSLFAKLDAIDPLLWAYKIVYSRNFSKRVSDAYKRCTKDPPTRDDCIQTLNLCTQKCDECKHCVDPDQLTKLNEIKGNKRREKVPIGTCQPNVVDADTNGGSKKRKKGEIVPNCPHQQIVDLWNDNFPQSQIKVWTPARKKFLAVRWKEDSERQDIQWWQFFFEWIKKSDFLCARTKHNFLIKVDFMMNASNFVKILEGNYHDRKKFSSQGTAVYQWLQSKKEKGGQVEGR